MTGFLKPLANRIRNMLARVYVAGIDDLKMVQTLQVEGLERDETREGVERFQNYGFTSVPLAGAEGIALFIGGVRDHGIVIAVDDRRYRLRNLEDGEVAMYTDEGDSIVIKRGGIVQVNATTIELTGNTNAVAKGEDLNSAIQTLGTAIAGAVSALPAGLPSGGAAQGATITTAVTAFATSAAAALSTKVKLS